MKILVIEDDHNKSRKICEFLREFWPGERVTERRAYQSGLKEAVANEPDLIVLDMTMPTYEISPGEQGGRIRPYAGREILSALTRRKLRSKVVIVTQFESFGEGEEVLTLEQLRAQLSNDFPDNYVATVFYQPSESGWREKLERVVTTVKRTVESANDQDPRC